MPIPPRPDLPEDGATILPALTKQRHAVAPDAVMVYFVPLGAGRGKMRVEIPVECEGDAVTEAHLTAIRDRWCGQLDQTGPVPANVPARRISLI